MGQKQQKDNSAQLNLNVSKSAQICKFLFKVRTHKIVSPAIESLKGDWAKVNGGAISTIEWDTTEISFALFKHLMEASWEEKELKNLFDLYDVDGSGTISWKEYICV